MKPVNNKSLLHFLYDQMEKLDKSEISKEQAREQANLAKQANNCMKYELQRAATIMLIDRYKQETGHAVSLREIEGKNFGDVDTAAEIVHTPASTLPERTEALAQ